MNAIYFMQWNDQQSLVLEDIFMEVHERGKWADGDINASGYS